MACGCDSAKTYNGTRRNFGSTAPEGKNGKNGKAGDMGGALVGMMLGLGAVIFLPFFLMAGETAEREKAQTRSNRRR